MIQEATTPTSKAASLQGAGWTQIDATTWRHAKHPGPHAWPVALIISDLPRVKHETGHSQASDRMTGVRGRPRVPESKVAAAAAMVEAEGISRAEACRRAGIAKNSIALYMARLKKKAE